MIFENISCFFSKYIKLLKVLSIELLKKHSYLILEYKYKDKIYLFKINLNVGQIKIHKKKGVVIKVLEESLHKNFSVRNP